MAHLVETMAYNEVEVPWHGLGFPVKDTLTPAQMLKAAKLDWTVSKRPMFFDNHGTMQPVTTDLALVRDSDNTHLSTVGTTYKPVQNEEAMDFFKKFVTAGKMKMETAGSLAGGKYIWALATIQKDFDVGKKGTDSVKNYLLLCSPHVLGRALVMQSTSVRVVCWNTLNFSLGSSLRGGENAFRMPHSMVFNDDVKARAEEALGLSTKQAQEMKEAAQFLASKRTTDDTVKEYFHSLLKFDPKKAEEKKRQKKDAVAPDLKVPYMLPKLHEALIRAPGAELGTAAGTWWGALNAVTYVVDHQSGRDRGTALRSAWLGSKARLKREALDLALEMAK